MSDGKGFSAVGRVDVDADAQPYWQRTGYRFFPYAAYEDGRWWVLRLNGGFPEHDKYTVFIDGRAAFDVTGSSDHSSALVRSIAVLRPFEPVSTEPVLVAHTAAAVVFPVSRYVDYGSEHGQACPFCSQKPDGMARIGNRSTALRV